MRKKLVSTVVAFGLILAVISFFNGREVPGILPIGSDAVYIEGEACTINMQLARSSTSIRNDFRACMGFHAVFVRRVCTSTVSTASISRPKECRTRARIRDSQRWNVSVGGGWALTTTTSTAHLAQ